MKEITRAIPPHTFLSSQKMFFFVGRRFLTVAMIGGASDSGGARKEPKFRTSSFRVSQTNAEGLG
jgi:hypothetical protein